VPVNKWMVSRRGHPLRPDAFLVVCESKVIGVTILPEGPGPAQTLELLAEVMAKPLVGAPRRPGRLLVRGEHAREHLAARLGPLGIEVTDAEIDDVLAARMREIESFEQEGAPLDGLVRSAGGPLLSALFAAAARFHRAEPWLRFGDGEPFEASCDEWSHASWFATVMGSVGDVTGLALHPTWASLRTIYEGREEEIEPDTLALAFGDRTQIPFADLDAVSENGLEVNGTRGFPLIFRARPGKDVRRPNRGELEVLEACLLALAALSRIPPTGSGKAVVEVETSVGRRRVTLERREFGPETGGAEDG